MMRKRIRRYSLGSTGNLQLDDNGNIINNSLINNPSNENNKNGWDINSTASIFGDEGSSDNNNLQWLQTFLGNNQGGTSNLGNNILGGVDKATDIISVLTGALEKSGKLGKVGSTISDIGSSVSNVLPVVSTVLGGMDMMSNLLGTYDPEKGYKVSGRTGERTASSDVSASIDAINPLNFDEWGRLQQMGSIKKVGQTGSKYEKIRHSQLVMNAATFGLSDLFTGNSGQALDKKIYEDQLKENELMLAARKRDAMKPYFQEYVRKTGKGNDVPSPFAYGGTVDPTFDDTMYQYYLSKGMSEVEARDQVYMDTQSNKTNFTDTTKSDKFTEGLNTIKNNYLPRLATGGLSNTDLPDENAIPLDPNADLVTNPDGSTQGSHEQGQEYPVMGDNGVEGLVEPGEVVADINGEKVVLSKRLGFAQKYQELSEAKQQLLLTFKKVNDQYKKNSIRRKLDEVDKVIASLPAEQDAMKQQMGVDEQQNQGLPQFGYGTDDPIYDAYGNLITNGNGVDAYGNPVINNVLNGVNGINNFNGVMSLPPVDGYTKSKTNPQFGNTDPNKNVDIIPTEPIGVTIGAKGNKIEFNNSSLYYPDAGKLTGTGEDVNGLPPLRTSTDIPNQPVKNTTPGITYDAGNVKSAMYQGRDTPVEDLPSGYVIGGQAMSTGAETDKKVIVSVESGIKGDPAQNKEFNVTRVSPDGKTVYYDDGTGVEKSINSANPGDGTGSVDYKAPTDTNGDGVIDENDLPPVDDKDDTVPSKGGWKDVLDAAIPFLDNIVNRGINRNRPDLPEPTMDTMLPIDTNVNYGAYKRTLSEQRKNAINQVKMGTNNPQDASNMINQLNNQYNNALATVEEREAAQESQLKNINVQNVNAVNANNNAKIDKHNIDEMMYTISKQDATSANVSNAMNDIYNQLTRSDQKEYQALQLKLIEYTSRDSGVMLRMLEELGFEKIANIVIRNADEYNQQYTRMAEEVKSTGKGQKGLDNFVSWGKSQGYTQ